jgi:hypothetical protein
MEFLCSSETSVDFQRTTQRYRTVHSHRCENLKSNKQSLFSVSHINYHIVVLATLNVAPVAKYLHLGIAKLFHIHVAYVWGQKKWHGRQMT